MCTVPALGSPAARFFVACSLLLLGTALAAGAAGPVRVQDAETTAPAAVDASTTPHASAGRSAAPSSVLGALAVGDSTGAAVAAAGDVNGDGYSDYLVGSPGAGSLAGRVDVYLGHADGSITLQRTLTSSDVGSRFGAAVACAGDVNGDGYDDIVIGQPDKSPAGQVWVFHGGPGGVAATPDTIIAGTRAGGRLGASVAGAGDVNGDTFGDIVAGAPEVNGVLTVMNGAAYVWYGGPGGVHGPATTVNGADAHEHLGTSVAGVGDVDADGYDDVVLGAPSDQVFLNQGRIFLHRGASTGIPIPPSATVPGGVAGEEFGRSVAPAGDFDGDGYADVVVGSPYAANGVLPECGKAYVLHGSSSGLAALGAPVLTGTQGLARLGWSVGCAGDANGDGLADIVVGEPLFDGGGVNEGRAHLFFGFMNNNSPGGIPEQVIPFAGGAGSLFGAAVSGIGDLSSDGFGDLAIGAPMAAGAGSVTLVAGQAAVAARSTAFALSNTSSTTGYAGFSVATGGDFNGDGFDDGIMGVPGAQVMVPGEGLVYALMGSSVSFVDGGFNTNQPRGHQAGCGFGQAVAVAGDVNGDGYDDALVGAPLYTSGASGEGAAFLLLGGTAGLDTLPSRTWLGGAAGRHWGSAVSSAGDMDGDGYLDVAIGSSEDGTNGVRAGRVAIYRGGPSGPPTSPAFELFGAAAGESLGVAIAAAGDVNGDGYDDLLVGAPGWSSGLGRAVLVFGAPAPPYATATLASSLPAGSGFGHAVAGRGDVDGDGFADVAIGAPYAASLAGAVEVHLGGAGGPNPAPVATLAGNPAYGPAVRFGSAVSFGDLTADGWSDLVVGAPGEANTAPDQGALEVYLSSGGGAFAAPARLTKTQTSYVARGASAAANSDFNGDGFADVMDGAPLSFGGWGAAEFWAGGGSVWTRERIERMRRDDFVTPVALLGLSDTGNSIQLALRARTAAGRQTMTVQYQAGTLAQPFSGLPVNWSVVIKPGVPGASGTYADVGQGLLGLAPGANERWRFRVHTRVPWFPTTPWLTPSGNAATLADIRMPVVPSAVGPAAPAATLALADVRPNPGAGAVLLAFTLPAAGRVRLAVYDASGRLVRELADGPRAAGEERLTWDGSDASGRAAPAGVYFARLEGAGQAVTRRFARLR